MSEILIRLMNHDTTEDLHIFIIWDQIKLQKQKWKKKTGRKIIKIHL